MFKRFISLFQQDFKVATRNKFRYVVLFLAALMIIVINFVVPREVKITPKEMFLDLTEERVLEKFLREQKIDEARIFDSREDLKQELNTNKNTLGVIMEGKLDQAKFTVMHQGTETDEILNLLDSTIEETLDYMRNNIQTKNYEVKYLRDKTSPIPFNKNLVPIMMIFEVVMFGFIVIAVMVFHEKQEGSIMAYRITPGGVVEYILSKALVNVLLALLYGGLIVSFTIGLNVNYINLTLLIVLTNFLMTIIGLFISVFFKNLSEFLFAGLLVIFIFAVPITSYLYPSFAHG